MPRAPCAPLSLDLFLPVTQMYGPSGSVSQTSEPPRPGVAPSIACGAPAPDFWVPKVLGVAENLHFCQVLG